MWQLAACANAAPNLRRVVARPGCTTMPRPWPCSSGTCRTVLTPHTYPPGSRCAAEPGCTAAALGTAHDKHTWRLPAASTRPCLQCTCGCVARTASVLCYFQCKALGWAGAGSGAEKAKAGNRWSQRTMQALVVTACKQLPRQAGARWPVKQPCREHEATPCKRLDAGHTMQEACCSPRPWPGAKASCWPAHVPGWQYCKENRGVAAPCDRLPARTPPAKAHHSWASAGVQWPLGAGGCSSPWPVKVG